MDLKIREQDVLQVLKTTRFVLFKRIRDGVYPEPQKDQFNGRYIFTTVWLDVARHNEAELQRAQIKVEKIKEEALQQRKRFERETLSLL